MSDGHRRAQAAIQAILRLTNLLMAGKRVAVIGDEPELAARLRAMGAQTLLADPAAALRGHRVLAEDEAVALADLVVGATEAHLPFLRDGAILIPAAPPARPSGTGEPHETDGEPPTGPPARPSGTDGEPPAGPSGTGGGPSGTGGVFAGLPGVRVRDGITGYRLGPGREVFVLDMSC
ncbi:hypothetical protein SAMN05216275_115112 [Streptosporangium canum]|uniref:S-adenosyl-L-homocysteine hydrolase NAD binding domain-containing protein n=1 Tax=Streptosporangium canum TaxID=324952 RepID=A0A1I3W0K8_9ACTN|nr:hypothetical protein [Streptosporangium canum]SFK00960.1 hypothetical protein SAMN05216275_115112 [Streptosporangium canum]